MVVDSERLWAGLYLAATGVWFGGLVTIPILAATTARLVDPATRTELFVVFGRKFAVVMGVLLAAALLAGAALMGVSDDALTVGAFALAVSLLVMTAVGVLQARRLSSLRRIAGRAGSGVALDDVHRNATVALALRSAIAVVSLAQLCVAVVLVGTS